MGKEFKKNPHYELRKNSYTYEDIIKCGNSELFGKGNPQLPLPNMLMFDRITYLSEEEGVFKKGKVIAELDINPNLWFFECHFRGDPVMPGCLGLDAMWQLLGFYLGWLGGIGKGRAIGLGNLRFSGEILPANKIVQYHIDIKRIVMGRLTMGIADGKLFVDDQEAFYAQDMRVALAQPT